MSRDKKTIPFFISILLLWSNGPFAQQKNEIKPDQYRAINLTTADGLPSGIGHVMLKDDRGFLWIGSTAGLKRYDGSIFRDYAPNDSTNGAINSTIIYAFVEDSLHNIWIGTQRGLSRYDSRADTFKNFLPSTATEIESHEGIIPFWATKEEVFCIEPGFRITSYNVHSLASKLIIQLSEKDSLHDGVARCSGIYDARSNSIWLLPGASQPGLIQIYLADNPEIRHPKYQIFKKNGDVIGHGSDSEAMCLDKKRNCIWLNSPEGLIQFTLSDQQFHYVHALDPFTDLNDYRRYVGIDMDPNGRIWLATGPGGFLIYDPETQVVSQPLSDPVMQERAAEHNQHLYCDRDGIVWSSNYMGYGLYELIPMIQPVKRLVANPNRKGFLSSGLIFTILPGPQGKIWVGTIDGLNIYDPKTETSEVLREKDLPGIRGTAIVPFYIDTIRQKAWINATKKSLLTGGYYKMDMYEMNLMTRQCKPIVFRDGSKIINNFSVPQTLVSPYKGGIVFCDESHGVFEIKQGSLTADLIVSHKHGFGAFSLFDDRYLFLQAGGGLPNFTYENKNGRWIKTPHSLDTLNWFNFFYDKADQTVWISFRDELVHYNKQFRKIQTYKAKGSFNGTIIAMQTDNDGKLWVLTIEKEIGRLDPITGIYTRMRETDGYQKQEYSWYAPVAKDIRGNIYFGLGSFTGTAGPGWGLDRISPDQYASINKPRVYLQSIIVNQKPVVGFGDISNLEELPLKHHQNTFRIQAGIIDFFPKEKGNIRYKLEHDGKISEWQYPLDEIIRYDDLAPGSYILTIQASTNSGAYNGPEKTLVVNISPPFWQTWWFRIAVVLVVIGIIYGFIQYRSHDLKKRNILLEQRVNERTTQLMERTNELNNSLSELKTTQDQLIHAEKMASLGELTSGIAHEIKNPLNFINNFSELNIDLINEIEEEQIPTLSEGKRAEVAPIIKTLKKNLEKINHHGKRVDDIVKSMLQHSRVGNLTKEPVNVNLLCEESLKLAYHGFKAKEKTFNASFETHFDTGLPTIMGIPQDLSRVLLNLFNNAFYAVHDNKKKTQPVSTDASEAESSYTPKVRVSTKKRDNKVVITVSDNGTGIPSPIINKIFQPFFTTKPTGEGTGLGLSMSYDIITKSHGGELMVKSKEGIGTDFEIMLPVL